MTTKGFLTTAATCLLLISTSACSGSRSTTNDIRSANADDQSATTSSSPTADAGDTLTKAELEELYEQRIKEARMRFVQADVDFMTGMIGHHAQALIMSALAPTNGANPSIQTLAARIINAQKDEIAAMQKWLKDRGQPVPEVHIDGLSLMIHGAGDHGTHTNMPGMLSEAQLKELSEARGADFDQLFLTYMIQHHSGAITMVDKLFKTDGAGQDEASFKLASDINVDQITEIARMEKMRDALTKMAR